jgi:hypothetical protein
MMKSYVGGIGGAGTVGDDAADAVADVRDARPRVPFLENGPEALSVRMIGHSLDSWSWCCPEKYTRVYDETLFAFPVVIPVLAPFLKTTRHI